MHAKGPLNYYLGEKSSYLTTFLFLFLVAIQKMVEGATKHSSPP